MKTETITLRHAEHRYFDEVVSFLCSFIGQLMTLQAVKTGATRFGPEVYWFLEGNGYEWLIYPFSPLTDLANDSWPTEIRIEEREGHNIPDLPHSTDALMHSMSVSIQGTFVRYFETYRPLIVQAYGADPYDWPGVWSFGRVVRNGFAHGGTLEWRNPNAESVSWRGISYGPGQDGRQVLFRDLALPDVIKLMMEMDEAIPED